MGFGHDIAPPIQGFSLAPSASWECCGCLTSVSTVLMKPTVKKMAVSIIRRARLFCTRMSTLKAELLRHLSFVMPHPQRTCGSSTSHEAKAVLVAAKEPVPKKLRLHITDYITNILTMVIVLRSGPQHAPTTLFVNCARAWRWAQVCLVDHPRYFYVLLLSLHPQGDPVIWRGPI